MTTPDGNDDTQRCPCGHELTADGDCLVRDRYGVVHTVPRYGPLVCLCHERRVTEQHRT